MFQKKPTNLLGLTLVFCLMLSGSGVTVATSISHGGLKADFDGDGREDLAVGVPYDGALRYGGVSVIYGSDDGLKTMDSEFLAQGVNGVPGIGERF